MMLYDNETITFNGLEFPEMSIETDLSGVEELLPTQAFGPGTGSVTFAIGMTTPTYEAEPLFIFLQPTLTSMVFWRHGRAFPLVGYFDDMHAQRPRVTYPKRYSRAKRKRLSAIRMRRGDREWCLDSTMWPVLGPVMRNGGFYSGGAG